MLYVVGILNTKLQSVRSILAAARVVVHKQPTKPVMVEKVFWHYLYLFLLELAASYY